MIRRSFKSYLSTVFLLLSITCCYAGTIETFSNSAMNLNANPTIGASDDKYYPSQASYWSSINYLSVKNSVNIKLIDKNFIQAPNGTIFTVVVRVKQYKTANPNSYTTSDQTLQVTYNQNAGSNYKAIDSYLFTGAYRVEATVLSVTSSTYPTGYIPDVLELSASVTVDRIYPFNPADPISLYAPDNIQANELLPLQLLFTMGKQEFDIEWTTVDAGGEFSQVAVNMMNNVAVSTETLNSVFRNNATRVTIQKNEETISAFYNNDYLLVRVRHAAYDVNGVRKTGNWEYKHSISSGQPLKYNCWPITWHEQKLNWQFSASFAEDGKKKEVISYFDGTLRNRQTVTRNNTDEVGVLQENVYDEFGRPAASILPAPFLESNVNTPYLNYKGNFNLSTNNSKPYSIADIAGTTALDCEILPTTLSTSSGAAKYYSSQNPFQNRANYNKYIPDAEGYPLSVTQYTKDNTGRIKLQGGVGAAFQPGTGVTSNTTKYYYGKPSQRELDKMFGTDVGYAEHYSKNMVIDPNGQISLAYLNASGKTIATALSGPVPTNVQALPSVASAEANQVTERVFKPEQFVFNSNDLKITATTSYIATMPDDKVKLQYNIQQIITHYPDAQVNICSNCYYKLTVSITDDCGNKVALPGHTQPITIGSPTLFLGANPYANDIFADINFPKVGEYSIKFELAYDVNVIDNYVDKFEETALANGYLKKKFDYIKQGFLDKLDAAGCYKDCKTCQVQLANESEFKAMALKEFVDLGVRNQLEENLDNVNSWIQTLYNSLKSKCDALQSTCTYSDCDEYRNRMYADLSPQGQYGLFALNASTNQYSVPQAEANTNLLAKYFDAVFHQANPVPAEVEADKILLPDGTLRWIYSPEFTITNMIENWRDEWAAKFLKYHPEYCKLLFCEATSSYNNWEAKVKDIIKGESDLPLIPGAPANLTYAENAYNLLLNLDPFFANGAPGAPYKSALQAELLNYTTSVLKSSRSNLNLYQYVKYFIYCKDSDNPSNTSWPTCNPSCRLKDREWELFKQLYFELKQKYYVQARNNYMNTNPECSCVRIVGKQYTANPDSYKKEGEQETCPAVTDFILGVSGGSCNSNLTANSTNGSNYVSSPVTVKVYSTKGNLTKKVMVKLSYSEGNVVKYINVLMPSGALDGTVYLPDSVCASTVLISSVTCTALETTVYLSNNQTSSVDNWIQYYTGQNPTEQTTATENFPTTKNKITITLKDASGVPVAAPLGGAEVVVDMKRTVSGFHYHYSFPWGTSLDPYHQWDEGTFYNVTYWLVIPHGYTTVSSDEYVSSISDKRSDDHGHLNVVTEKLVPYCSAEVNGADNLVGLAMCTTGTPGGGGTPTCPEELFYANKRPVFPEYVNQVAVAVDPTVVSALVADAQAQKNAQVLNNCYDNAEAWIAKLAPGLHAKYPVQTAYDAIVDVLKTRFIAICSAGGNDSPFGGVSALAPGTTNSNGDNSFEGVIKQYVFNNGSLTPEINPWLINSPYPLFTPNRSINLPVSKTSSGICSKLSTLKTSFEATLAPGAYTVTGFHNYLLLQYGANVMRITVSELEDLLNSCNCGYLLAADIKIPVFLEDNGCITSSTYAAALVELKNKFSISEAALLAHANYPVILTNFMNHKFGFNLIYTDYQAYAGSGLLCNDVSNGETPLDKYACVRGELQSVLYSGLYAYNKYIEEERNKFRADYIAQCSLAQNTADLTTKAPKYHYTLYYYDQADNLVRTIPPEGVKLLTDDQLNWVEQNRLLEGSACTDDPIICNGTPVTYSTDKVAAFTQVSNALTGGGARAFEFWLYNSAYTSDYQMIQVTPDKKYMMHVRVNNGLVGFDLYPVLESTDQLSVSIKPSTYHYRGTFTGQAGAPWLHLVVQGTNIATGGVPQIYLNGVALSVSSTATDMSPGWSIQATSTGIVYPDNTTMLKHLRIYSRLMTAGEISTNAGDNCFKPSNGCNGMLWYRFNVPAPGSETTIAANSTVEGKTGGLVPSHGLATTYAYSSTNQVLQQKSPDGGVNRFWYDDLSRLVASQNDKQQPVHKYSFTTYDVTLGRIDEVGEKTIAAANDNFMGEPGYISKNTYRQSFLPAGTNGQITHTYYDDVVPTVSGNTDGIASITGQQNLRKRVAATTYRETQSGAVQQATYYNYDISGNVKTLWQQIEGLTQASDANSLKRLDYEYDLISGKVNFVAYQHNATNAKPDQFYYQYKYDAENRLIEAWSGLAALFDPLGGSVLLPYSERLDASYWYYLHGPLARVELGDRPTKVQGLDYAYTLQGWLKGVNGAQLNHATEIGLDGTDNQDFVPRDAFAFSLGYYNGDYKAIGSGTNAFALKFTPGSGDVTGHNLYNGNIGNTTIAIDKINNGATAGYTYRYDQLNRLIKTRMHSGISGSAWTAASIVNDYREDVAYDANGNILTYKRYSNNTVNASGNGLMDQLTYRYNKVNNDLVNNRLRYIDDAAGNGTATDLRDQSSGNYQYDAIGNLTADVQAGINTIDWTVYGKIKSIDKAAGNDLAYAYDATGNRVKKTAGSTNTYYVRDAQGNTLAVYMQTGGVVTWGEQQLYGSSRLGLWQPNVNLATAGAAQTEWQKAGLKRYELNNHLGNVLATITDRRLQHPTEGNQNFDYYTADVITAQDYYPFGMIQPGRTYANNNATYRYGFNGKENDNDVGKGDGNQQDYGMRIYDPRVGRFLSVDPLTQSYPWFTPYQFAQNDPIRNIDLDGLEGGSAIEYPMREVGRSVEAAWNSFSSKLNNFFRFSHSSYGMSPTSPTRPAPPIKKENTKPVLKNPTADNVNSQATDNGVHLGGLSEKYESSGPETVSTGIGDVGGVSYGSWQLASKRNRPEEFLSSEGSKWADQFEGLESGSKEFTKIWKSIAQKEPAVFKEAQRKFIQRTHYDISRKNVDDIAGLDIDKRSAVLRDVLWSTSVQHGPGNQIFQKALMGKDVKNMSDAEIITAIYEERGRKNDAGVLVHFGKNSKSTQDNVSKRFKKEEKDALEKLNP